MELKKTIIAIDGEKIVCETSLEKVNVVVLHGAGESLDEWTDRVRFTAIV